MNTITRFTARNFQSHENSTIVPGPAGTLTVLTGGSDEGKSALLRALKWVLYNQPQGDSFRRMGCDFVEVELETESGTVVRRRTSSTNRYVVNGEVFEGFGNTVPMEVQAVTGVRTVRLGDQEIMANLAGQLDAPFLGSSISGPARAKVLGVLAGISVMDKANRDINGDIYRIRTKTSQLEEEAERLDAEIEKYDHLPGLAEKIGHLRAIAKRVKEAEDRHKTLSNHFNTLAGIKHLRHAAIVDLNRWSRLPQAEYAVSRYADLSTRHKRMGLCLAQITYIRQRESESQQTAQRFALIDDAASAAERVSRAIERQRRIGSLAKRLEDTEIAHFVTFSRLRIAENTTQVEPAYTKILADTEKHSRLHRLRTRLEALRQQQQQATGQLELATQTMVQATQVYEKTLFEAGSCPTCGALIDHDQIHEHIKEVVSQ